MNASLDLVLQHPGIWRGDRLAQTGEDTLPTGFAELDEQLPGGGWPRGALTEILLETGRDRRTALAAPGAGPRIRNKANGRPGYLRLTCRMRQP